MERLPAQPATATEAVPDTTRTTRTARTARCDPRAEPDGAPAIATASPVLARILLARRAAVVDVSYERPEDRPREAIQRRLPGPGLAWCAVPDAATEVLPLS